MKTTASVSALLVALAASTAFAADLPASARLPPPAVLPPDAPVAPWTGFYAGLNAGATWGNSNSAQWATFPVYLNPNSLGAAANAQAAALVGSPPTSLGSQLGFIGGGQVGYSHQFGQSFVAGVEADIQGAAGASGGGRGFQGSDYTFTSSATFLPTPSTMVSTNAVTKTLNYLGTARGKIGYLVTPTLEVYGTGGLAYGGVTLNTFAWQKSATNLQAEVGPSANSQSSTSVGWTAGGGVEWMFAPAWSLKAEYLYYDLGSRKQFAGPLARVWLGGATGRGLANGDFLSLMSTNVSARLNGNVARVGVNYHFNIGDAAPIIAKF